MLLLLLLAQDLLVAQSGKSLRVYAVEGERLVERSRLDTPGAPIYLRASADGRRLYAALIDSVAAFSFDGAALATLNSAPSPGGSCYVDVHGDRVVAPSYGGGSTWLYALESDGRLKEGTSTPSGKQSHASRFHPSGRFHYTLSVADAKITRFGNDGPRVLEMPGLGPRHIAFAPDGRTAYVVHERPIKVTALKVDPESGALEPLRTLGALPEGAVEKKELAAAEIAAAPSGRFVYASIRDFSKEGDLNLIAVFAVEDGGLRWVEAVPSGGVSPRGFLLDRKGERLFVANELSKSIVVFGVDPVSGRLSRRGEPTDVGGSVIGLAWLR